jgi:hypothetical protein
MKQNITLSQWQELSLGEQRRFQEVSEKGGLPTIGRMIEFLNQNLKYNWEIRMHDNLFDVNYPDSKTSPDFEDYNELCDALWDIVKETLGAY